MAGNVKYWEQVVVEAGIPLPPPLTGDNRGRDVRLPKFGVGDSCKCSSLAMANSIKSALIYRGYKAAKRVLRDEAGNAYWRVWRTA